MLGGCVYPLDVVGTTVRIVGHAVPQAWAMDAFIRLIYHHATFTTVLPEIGAFGRLCGRALRARRATLYQENAAIATGVTLRVASGRWRDVVVRVLRGCSDEIDNDPCQFFSTVFLEEMTTADDGRVRLSLSARDALLRARDAPPG